MIFHFGVLIFFSCVACNWAENVDNGNHLPDFSTEKSTKDVLDMGCHCSEYNCGCCEPVNLYFTNGIVCIRFSYLPNEYGISFIVTYNNSTLYNSTISARNPPELCVGIPELENFSAEACIKFHDLTVKSHSFHGCVQVTIQLYHLIHRTAIDKCFDLPPVAFKASNIIRNIEPEVIII